MSRCFKIYNSATAALTASPPYQSTGTSIRTMLQIKSSAPNFTVINWGYDLDIATPAAAVKVELLSTGTVAATGLTAFNPGDIVKWSDPGATSAELTSGTGASGFAASAPTEGTITATRLMDTGASWANYYEPQYPLERDTNVLASDYLRIRVTTATSVGMRCWVIIEMK